MCVCDIEREGGGGVETTFISVMSYLTYLSLFTLPISYTTIERIIREMRNQRRKTEPHTHTHTDPHTDAESKVKLI